MLLGNPATKTEKRIFRTLPNLLIPFAQRGLCQQCGQAGVVVPRAGDFPTMTRVRCLRCGQTQERASVRFPDETGEKHD